MGHEEALPVEVACAATAAWVGRLSQVLSLFLVLRCVSGEGVQRDGLPAPRDRGKFADEAGPGGVSLRSDSGSGQQQKSPEGCGGGSADGCRRCDSGTR